MTDEPASVTQATEFIYESVPKPGLYLVVGDARREGATAFIAAASNGLLDGRHHTVVLFSNDLAVDVPALREAGADLKRVVTPGMVSTSQFPRDAPDIMRAVSDTRAAILYISELPSALKIASAEIYDHHGPAGRIDRRGEAVEKLADLAERFSVAVVATLPAGKLSRAYTLPASGILKVEVAGETQPARKAPSPTGGPRLAAADVAEMRFLAESYGFRAPDLAVFFGVTPQMVAGILAYKSWTEVSADGLTDADCLTRDSAEPKPKKKPVVRKKPPVPEPPAGLVPLDVPDTDGAYLLDAATARVWSLTRGRWLNTGVIDGLPYVTLRVSTGRRGQRALYMHRFMCEYYNGPAPEGHVPDARNGDRTDLRPDNLFWRPSRGNTNRSGSAKN